MFIIKKYLDFINEALKDEIPKHYKDLIKDMHGSKILNKEVPVHTDKIPNVKIEITDEKYLNNISEVIKDGVEKNICDEFFLSDLYKKIVDIKLFHNGKEIFYSNKNHIKLLFSNEINLPDMKVNLPNNEYQISKNKSNIVKFLSYFNRLKGTDYSINDDKRIKGLMTFLGDYENNLNNLKNDKLYLYITDKSYDKLNMSLSKYYDSCQNIYDGTHKIQLLANVFDPNTKVAYIISETPFYDKKGNKVNYSPLYRCLIRYDENSDKTMFDVAYPKINTNPIYSIIEEYTDLKNEKINAYTYKVKEDLPKSYMDSVKSISDIDLTPAEIKKMIRKEFPKSKITVVNKDEIMVDGAEYCLTSEKDVYNRKYDDTFERFQDIVLDNREEFKNMLQEHVILCKDILTFLELDDDKLLEIANMVDNNTNNIDYDEEIEEFLTYIEDELGIDWSYDLDNRDFITKYFDFNKYLVFYKQYHDYDLIEEYGDVDSTYLDYNGSNYYLEQIY